MDINKNVVSVLMPCYNSEKWVGRALNSILAQTHKDIEVVCVNDGSTDNTQEVLIKFKSEFEQQGKLFKYYYQRNQGQSAAIDLALKHFTGEYLCWIDDDDFWDPTFMEKMVRALQNNKDCGVATCDFRYVNEQDINTSIKLESLNYGGLSFQKRQFELAINGLSCIASGVHLIKTMDYIKINPTRTIVTCSEGQNLQLILPIYYHYNRVFIDEPLHTYVVRESSHWHRTRTEPEWYSRYDKLINMITSTMLNMGVSKTDIHRIINTSCYYRERLKYTSIKTNK